MLSHSESCSRTSAARSVCRAVLIPLCLRCRRRRLQKIWSSRRPTYLTRPCLLPSRWKSSDLHGPMKAASSALLLFLLGCRNRYCASPYWVERFFHLCCRVSTTLGFLSMDLMGYSCKPKVPMDGREISLPCLKHGKKDVFLLP